ncbi:PepSY domain-containing protein [Luteimonas sp. RIT-PG2_3]
MRLLKRQLQLWHRWFGIVLSLPILLWFVSGAVMVFVAFPRLSDAERRAGLEALAPTASSTGVPGADTLIPPDVAARRAGIEGVPANARLGMLGDRAVWRLLDGEGGLHVIAADGGAMPDEVDATQVDANAALAITSAFQARASGRTPVLRHDGLVDVDQWTINGIRDLRPPLHRLRADDGRTLYVSQVSGEVVRDVSAAESFWGWPGAVMHWIYLLPLRSNGPLWSSVVLWLSGISCVVALSGLVIGVWRSVDAWRRRRQFSAYRGLFWWHHLLGWTGGLLVLTWLFSGWMSMGPFDAPPNTTLLEWRRAWSDTPARWTTALRPPAWSTAQAGIVDGGHVRDNPVIEIGLVWLGGQPWYRIGRRDGRVDWQSADATVEGSPDVARLIAHATQASGSRLLAQTRLDRYDVHYLQHPHRDPKPLPVYKVELSDPARTWFYVSEPGAEIVGISDRTTRLDRWLYQGLHSWDLPWLLQHPRLREALLLLGLALGTALSLTGLILGCRHLGRVTFRPRR